MPERSVTPEVERLTDERDEWKLRAERAERERDVISKSLAKMDRKWKRAYYQLQEYQDRDGGPV